MIQSLKYLEENRKEKTARCIGYTDEINRRSYDIVQEIRYEHK
jgi:hypothetical protein